jgi:hypothetical protein
MLHLMLLLKAALDVKVSTGEVGEFSHLYGCIC